MKRNSFHRLKITTIAFLIVCSIPFFILETLCLVAALPKIGKQIEVTILVLATKQYIGRTDVWGIINGNNEDRQTLTFNGLYDFYVSSTYRIRYETVMGLIAGFIPTTVNHIILKEING